MSEKLSGKVQINGEVSIDEAPNRTGRAGAYKGRFRVRVTLNDGETMHDSGEVRSARLGTALLEAFTKATGSLEESIGVVGPGGKRGKNEQGKPVPQRRKRGNEA